MKCPKCEKPMRPEGCVWLDRAKAAICAECYAEFKRPAAIREGRGRGEK